jgi:1-acyl-sn-glycerol-3-phosphate acyltransferase
MISRTYRLIGIVSKPVIGTLFRLRAEGLDHIAERGFVLAANHTSNLDPWALGLPLFPRRQLRFMAKIELFNPILGPILNAGGAFPVRRGESDLEAIRTAVELVRAGELVVMFPEGTRRRKGLRKKFKPRAHTGAARIALWAEAPLIPAAIIGTDRLRRLGPIRVRYGSAIPTDDLRGLEHGEAAQLATVRLMTAIEELGSGR